MKRNEFRRLAERVGYRRNERTQGGLFRGKLFVIVEAQIAQSLIPPFADLAILCLQRRGDDVGRSIQWYPVRECVPETLEIIEPFVQGSNVLLKIARKRTANMLVFLAESNPGARDLRTVQFSQICFLHPYPDKIIRAAERVEDERL